MNRFDNEELLKKYREGKCSETELGWLEHWYADWMMKDRVVLSEVDLDCAEKLMRDAVLKRTAVKPVSLWPRIWVAASVIITLSIGVYFYAFRQGIVNTNLQIVHQQDISPGANKATLTFGNGKKITLSNTKNRVIINAAKLIYSDGSLVQGNAGFAKALSAAVNESLVAATPRGGTYQIVLPDGTRVWLNAESRLVFPSRFSGATRKITLMGEAYFEVAKDKEHPFIIQTDNQQVRVLGTHFNINAYKDGLNTITTLLEGAIEVSRAGVQGNTVLKPGQQFLLNSRNVRLQTVDVDEAIAWKNGYFQFGGKNLETAMLEIARWYDVEIEYKNNSLRSRPLAGTISRYNNVSAILKTMELTGVLHFKVSGRKIIVE